MQVLSWNIHKSVWLGGGKVNHVNLLLTLTDNWVQYRYKQSIKITCTDLRPLKYKCVHIKANLTFYSKRCSCRLHPQLFVGGFMSYVCFFFVFACVYSVVKHVLNIWVTWRVSYKRKNMLTIRKHLDSSRVFCGVEVWRRKI